MDFSYRKCLHIKLKKDTHTALRLELLKRQLSMQEVIEELSSQLVAGNPHLEKMLDEYVKRKAKERLEREEARRKGEPAQTRKFSEMDEDVLYKIINEDSPINQDEEENP